MITGSEIKYLCANFNSLLYRFYFNIILDGNNYSYGSKDVFKDIPIKFISNTQNIDKLVDTAINTCNKENIRALDKIIYEIYNLSSDEIEYIENYYDI
jgi:hypothetical protein